MCKVMIFGDICPDNNYRLLFDSMQNGPLHDAIVKEMRESALVIGNLECPATNNDKPISKCGPNLRAKPQDIEMLHKLGFSVLSLANNHILDYGFSGIEDTLAQCRACGINTVGAEMNANAAAEPLLIEVNGKKIGILSFAEAEFNLSAETTYGANHFDPYTSFDAVADVKKYVDYVIILYHGGIEYYQYPSPLLQKKCKAFVRSGANLVLCQHSHCIGTLEKYQNGTILYGQGNSIFGHQKTKPEWNEGIVIILNIDTEEINLRVIEAKADGIHFAEEHEEKKRIARMLETSQALNDTEEMKAQWLRFCQQQAALDLPLLYGKNRIYIKLNRILRNNLIDKCVSRRKQMITMNLIRCESHHEVLQTILENKIFN